MKKISQKYKNSNMSLSTSLGKNHLSPETFNERKNAKYLL